MKYNVNIIVKWSGKEYAVELAENDTIAQLKNIIQKQTGVQPDRQKLLNLKYKGKTPNEDCRIGLLNLKSGFKLMMMGSLEAEIEKVIKIPTELPEIHSDLDVNDEKSRIEKANLAKIQRRIKEYEIKMLSPSRPGKNLLVLDIDYTLWDCSSVAETGAELMRPYLHEFLTSAYEDYDIVIWSATAMKYVEKKMDLLGVTRHGSYKIMFYLDELAMITMTKVQWVPWTFMDVKPLEVIWGKFEQYNSKNSIILDDMRENFLMNPKNGLEVSPFREAHFSRQTDKELLLLSKYLKDLATHCKDFSTVNHKLWKSYNPKQNSDKR